MAILALPALGQSRAPSFDQGFEPDPNFMRDVVFESLTSEENCNSKGVPVIASFTGLDYDIPEGIYAGKTSNGSVAIIQKIEGSKPFLQMRLCLGENQSPLEVAKVNFFEPKLNVSSACSVDEISNFTVMRGEETFSFRPINLMETTSLCNTAKNQRGVNNSEQDPIIMKSTQQDKERDYDHLRVEQN